MRVITDDMWTRFAPFETNKVLRCDECGKALERAILMDTRNGQPAGFDGVKLCKDCLINAVAYLVSSMNVMPPFKP